MKEILAKIHSTLANDAGVLAILGSASQVRRRQQARKVEPPCITIGAQYEKRLVEGTDRLRDAEVRISAWGLGDRDCSDLAEAIVAALDEADLSDETLHSYACIWIRAEAEPEFDPEATAFKKELAFRAIYRLK